MKTWLIWAVIALARPQRWERHLFLATGRRDLGMVNLWRLR